ncbi:hypothetical protein TUM19329_18640 [Legionella antarctica]|uniref:Beta-xylosidase n=1 Tax=Legionella antarctica TaxID=2708020 RepID=A0A6F8T5L8_9GAMM|nr:hypothetical protein [Legionella antarctica]BCA95503.1 hypothetical protein TUM19329_18640 [Legionella antarctica]
MSNDYFKWNKYSDQPEIIADKKTKRAIYLKGSYANLKTLLVSLLIPLIGIKRVFQPRVIPGTKVNCFGLCVNPDYPLPEKTSPNVEQLKQMVDEINVSYLLIRFPLADYDHKEKYFEFIQHFSDKPILIHILQDRKHIDNPKCTEQHLREIFSRVQQTTRYFQIGNSVNRKKWTFISMDEYFAFFQIAQRLQKKEFPEIKLIGSSIIDFELPFIARSLLHWWPIKYDGVGIQLYVDRRGAPENKQFGCDTISKINWIFSIMQMSRKTVKSLWITEVNWPVLGTEPYAPAYGDCMVSEETQTAYLVRYFLLAIASGRVNKCYWHQLVSPGYGLVDNRGSTLRKRGAFYSYKTMIKLLDGGKTISFSELSQVYRLKVEKNNQIIEAVWTNNFSSKINIPKGTKVLNIFGELMGIDNNQLHVSACVVYLISGIDNYIE